MKLIPESELRQTMETVVEPRLQSLCVHGRLDNALNYELFPLPQAKGTVVISHGFTEACVKYHEFIYYLLEAGYQCAVLDHRGHGFSVRETAQPCLVHIADFSQYVRDFYRFVHTVVLPAFPDAPLLLYGHSMGGCIAAHYLESYPQDFQRAVLNAPMLGLQLGAAPVWLAAAVCRLFLLLGKGQKPLFFHGDFRPDASFEEDYATSRARFDYYHALRVGETALQTSSASYTWALEALKAGRRAVKNAAKIDVPVLLFQAENDSLVSPRAQEAFIGRLREGRLVRVAGAKHEIFRSDNATLEGYWQTLLAFLAG